MKKHRVRIMNAAMVFLIALGWPVLEANADFVFHTFDGPNAGSGPGAGTFANGISNNGAIVGFTMSNGTNTNFIRNPDGSFTQIIPNDFAAMANGINSSKTMVGVNGQMQAIQVSPNGTVTPLSLPGTNSLTSAAFGINDKGTIVGQYTAGGQSPGFILDGSKITTINAPSGPNTVFAQGINNNGRVVGFYVGTDGQDHGFTANANSAVNGVLTGTPIADPKIPAVPGEPGATFVFSQILGINDHGIAVGYYGDSTTSQHGFLYNFNTGKYTFVDDPNEQFSIAGVEVTQITGINNAGEITGFYTDANGTAHGFYANPTPEPASLTLLSIGLVGLAGYGWRRRKAVV